MFEAIYSTSDAQREGLLVCMAVARSSFSVL